MLQPPKRFLKLLMSLPNPLLRKPSLATHTNQEDGRKEVVVREGHPRTRQCSLFGILRHQPGSFIDLVQVLVHNIRFVQRSPIHDEHWNLSIGADAQEFFTLVTEIDLIDIEINMLFVQDHPGPPSVGSLLSIVQSWLHLKLVSRSRLLCSR